MGANASAQMAFDKAQGAVTAATGGITKCMSKDTGQVVCPQMYMLLWLT